MPGFDENAVSGWMPLCARSFEPGRHFLDFERFRKVGTGAFPEIFAPYRARLDVAAGGAFLNFFCQSRIGVEEPAFAWAFHRSDRGIAVVVDVVDKRSGLPKTRGGAP